MRLYDAGQNAAKGIWRNHAAVLDCAVKDDQMAFSGGLDRAVRMYEASWLHTSRVRRESSFINRPHLTTVHVHVHRAGSTWTGQRTPG